MGRKRLKMNIIREVLKMSIEYQISNRKIARALKVSRPVVAKYLSVFNQSGLLYSELKNTNDDELLKIFKLQNNIDKPKLKRLYGNFPYYAKELTKTGVTRELLWQEYLEKEESGYSYSQFCYYFNKWQNNSALTMNLNHKAGDKLFVDFTGKKMKYYDRESGNFKFVEVFVGVLGASKLIYAEPLLSQDLDNWINGNQNAFLYIGGVPKAVVPDCLKSGVTKGSKYEPLINPVYNDFAEHYDTVILPARPYHPKDKALVENAVKIVYRYIFAPLRDETFYSLKELKVAFRKRLNILNSKQMQHLKISRFELFNKTDKAALKILPRERYERRFFKQLTVNANYHIFLREDLHYYSVPFKFRNKRVKVVYTGKKVEIYYKNMRLALHTRSNKANAYTTNPDHMPQSHKYIYEWTPQKFIDKASKLGIQTEQFIRAIINKMPHPEKAFKICSGILSLAEKYSSERIEKACSLGLKFEEYSYLKINNILKNGLENILEEDNHYTIPDHGNIRGKEYYLEKYKNNGVEL
jgi:transposase